MDQRLLVEVIASALLSYEHATDTEVDPDWALMVMEGLAATLDRLSADDRSRFTAHLEALASELPDGPAHDGRRASYREVPRILGWEQPVPPAVEPSD